MDIYYIIFFVAFFLCFFDFVPYKSLKLFLYSIFCGVLIFLIGFRKVGIDNDSPVYEGMFYFYSNASFSTLIKGGTGYVEVGYTFFNKIISDFGGDFRTLLLLTALICGILEYSFIYKKTKYPFISLLTYLSFFLLYRDFTQIRYAICAGFCFWCVDFFISKKYIKALVYFIFAVSFHNAAIILLPILPFLMIFKKDTLLVLLPLPCLMIGLTINLFPFLLATGFANQHMEIYKKEEGGAGFALSFIGYLLVIIFILLDKFAKKVNFTEEQKFYFRIVAISISLNFLFLQSAIFQRFTYILFQFSILLIPVLLWQIKLHTKLKENFFILYFFLAAFLLFYGIRMIDPALIRPYENIF